MKCYHRYQYLDIAWSLSVFLLSIRNVSSQTGDNDQEAKYLILGAGLGGLSAAKTLADQGESDFLILEGSSRIGGRVKQGRMGGKTVELGSLWIQGGGTDDPVFKLAERTSLDTVDTDFNSVVVRDESGRDVTGPAVDRWDVFDDALAKFFDLQPVLETDNPYIPDISQRNTLSMYGWRPQDGTDYALEYFDMDFNYGHSPETASTRYSFFPNFGEFQEKIVVDQHGGLSKLVSTLASDIKDFQVSDPRLRLNTKVTAITYNDNNVQVTTDDGKIFTGQYAIVTFSLGVLKNQVITFSPPLPQWKTYSIQSATYVTDYPIYLKFPDSADSFWDITEYILYGSSRRGHFSMWHNYESYWPESRILQVQLSGAEGERIARLQSDIDIQNEIMAVLRRMYGNNVPNPDQILIPRWLTDPLFYGSYSDWSPAFPISSFEALAAPVGRVYFAGEAYDKNWFGYLQGAIYSGTATANSIMACDQDQSKCEEYTPPYESRGCTYKQATNYDRTAQVDDGSCSISGDSANNVPSSVLSLTFVPALCLALIVSCVIGH